MQGTRDGCCHEVENYWRTGGQVLLWLLGERKPGEGGLQRLREGSSGGYGYRIGLEGNSGG